MDKIIGKIKLDERFYAGRDIYSDGAIEDTLLQISEEKSKEEYRKVTEEYLSWPVLYHFSPFRENIVEWIPLSKSDKVLEVGSGCGAITGILSKKAGEVTCVDLSEKRSMVNANRLKDADNVTIMVGNFKEIETALPDDYDAIMLIGVFEYAYGYMESKNPYEDFLNILLKHLKKGGHLYIAIENRMGLKYFAGCTEDHAGRYFEGLEGYPGGGVAKTFTRKALEKIFASCGVTEYSFYYPYPDYKFPHTIFSDDVLPKKGELHDNIRNFDRNRLILMDETKVFDTILEDGEFPLFSNSYMVNIGPEIPAKMVKYSTDRDEKYGVVTSIEKTGSSFVVKKRAADARAKEHIENIEKAYELLTKAFEGSDLKFNRFTKEGEDTLVFEYLEGKTLEELLDEALWAKDKEAFLSLHERYKNYVLLQSESEVYDYDLIFQNIIVNDDAWTVIDYEWTKAERGIPDELIRRAYWCYIQGNSARRTALEWISLADPSEDVIRVEQEFQKKVQGEHKALSEIRHEIGKAAFSLDYIRSTCGDAMEAVQIYEDTGEGFSEEKSYKVEEFKQTGKKITLELSVGENIKKLRIDPGNNPAFVIVEKAELEGENLLPGIMKKEMISKSHNGKRIGADGFLFPGPDPHFEIKIPSGNKERKLILTMTVDVISPEVASRLNG